MFQFSQSLDFLLWDLTFFWFVSSLTLGALGVVKLHNSVWWLSEQRTMKLSPKLRINSEVNLQKTDIRDSINHSILSFNSYSFQVLSLVDFCFSIPILLGLVGFFLTIFKFSEVPEGQGCRIFFLSDTATFLLLIFPTKRVCLFF